MKETSQFARVLHRDRKENALCVTECITSKNIIKVASSRDQIILRMDAFLEDRCEAPMLRKMMLLYSYCSDTERVFELNAPSLPFLKLNVCLGIIVFLEPFLNRGLLFSRKSPTVTEN